MSFNMNGALTTHVIWTQLTKSVNIIHKIEDTWTKLEEKSQILNLSKEMFRFLQGAMAE